MINLLRVLVTGGATQIDLLTGEQTSLSLPWNIRWRLVVGSVIALIQDRLWPIHTIEVAHLSPDDEEGWEIPSDWFNSRQEKDSDPQAD